VCRRETWLSLKIGDRSQETVVSIGNSVNSFLKKIILPSFF